MLAKGYFSHISNVPKNWGILRQEPFPLSTYINEQRDSKSLKEEKAKWHHEKSTNQLFFDSNDECVKYCDLDVLVLLKSSLKFIMQAFQFGEEMIARFGKSPAYREGLTMQHLHPFSKHPTLDSFS